MSTATARPSWTGVLQFGLVPIGVKLFPVAGEYKTPFVSVHPSCMAPFKQVKKCSKCGRANCVEAKAVDVSDQPDRTDYVVLTDADLESLTPASRKRITLDQFPEVAEVLRPELIEETYYVQPSTEGDREAYWSLWAALRASSAAGVGKVSFRSRERLAAILPHQPTGGMICLVLRFPSELRAIIGDAAMAVDDDRLAKACALIEQIRHNSIFPLSPILFRDDYEAKVTEIVAGKRPPALSLTEALVASVASTVTAKVVDRRRKAA